jgi:hypothetical protein
MKLLSSAIPVLLKAKVKTRLLHTLHAKPEITSRVATRIIREGVPRYLGWSYDAEKEQTLRYIDSLRVGDYAYKFARSSPQATLYGSIYASMLLGIFGELEAASAHFKNRWLEYLDSFQDPTDGYFRDPALAGPEFEGALSWGDGWGIRHLAGHILIAYARLGRPPRHAFRFLEPYYEHGHLRDWLARFDFSHDVWSQSNYIMNVYTLLQYARDFMGARPADAAIKAISQWLISKQRNDTGMWHDYVAQDYPQLGDAIRGAYHFYPLFAYEGQAIPEAEAVIETILRSQNSWGGFNPEEMPSGACEDIDAIEPLIRATLQSGHKREEVDLALRRAMVWILSCKTSDGGFEFIPEHGQSYGGHPLSTSQPGEANLFATWFRSLCLAYVVDYLSAPNAYTLGTYPGYEIALPRPRSAQ